MKAFRHRGRVWPAVALVVSLVSLLLLGLAVRPTDGATGTWEAAWGVPPVNAKFPPAADQSFRMIVRPTVGGRAIRIRLSNAFGDDPVRLTSLSIARRLSGPAVDPATVTPLTFQGKREVTIGPHRSAVSDPTDMPFRYGDDLAVSFHLPGNAPQVTGHGASAAIVTSYLTPPGAGDTTGDTSGGAFTESTQNKYFLTGLDASVPKGQGTVVAFGDSITDGTGSVPDRFDDYPDQLAARLNSAGYRLGVVNAGIAGNTVLFCQASAGAGDPAETRFARDALQQPNVRAVILMEGGNDLRICPPPVDAIEAGLRSLIDRAHAAHLAVLLGTYPPHVSRYDESVATGEAMREQLNRWIREQGAKHVVEGVVDFDAALRDPASPDRQRAGSGSADGIHPGPPGYQIMADLVPLKALVTASH